jgi:hypothetical protein
MAAKKENEEFLEPQLVKPGSLAEGVRPEKKNSHNLMHNLLNVL